MGRPFRLHPPSLPAGALARPRLLELLDRRWQQRLVTVTAGPGFGKTVLLVDAMAHAAAYPHGVDIWLSCEPADESEEHLLAGLASAAGLPAPTDVSTLADRLWAMAPAQVCLVLDDVHEVPPGSPGADVLARLMTELPANAHAVFASRDSLPLPTARLAAAGQLVRVREEDLLLDETELTAFALSRGVDPTLLESTGGWPALAELTANTGADLVLDYLWEEVLARVGPERARLLAGLAMVGGGDDEMATALAGRPVRVDDVVATVPLVQRLAAGWAVLHPLWQPALRRVLDDEESIDVRRRAAEVHRRRGRLQLAVDVLADAEAWDDVLAMARDACVHWRAPVPPVELARWYRLLPASRRHDPAALLVLGLDLQARSPLEALPALAAAAEAFRRASDVEGELAAITQQGVIHWWAGDVGGLLALHQRISELAQGGSAVASKLERIGLGALANLTGHPERTLSELVAVDHELPDDWIAVVRWLRGVAHLRLGDLGAARAELDDAVRLPAGLFAPTIESARNRVAAFEGRVDEVYARTAELRDEVERSGSRQNAVYATLQLALLAALRGESQRARALLDELEPALAEMPGLLSRWWWLATRALVAICEGDEATAAELLRAGITTEMWTGAQRWALRELGGMLHVLLPEARQAWVDEPPGPAFRPGIVLAEALEAARNGDLSMIRKLDWPKPGVVRMHLPWRWSAELAAAGFAAGNPPPDALLAEVGPRAREALRDIARSGPDPRVAEAARRLLGSIPATPSYRVWIGAVGPLIVRRDGEVVDAPHLRRQRVRELACYLAVHRRVRRETAAADLWPELDDGGRNLRVTLNYLQGVLQPDRADREPPYFVRSEGQWLVLAGEDRLEVDAWTLDELLDAAAAAERDGATGDAVAAYLAALPLWRGEPFADAPYAAWAEPARARLRARFVTAAVRGGDLLLAAGQPGEARLAAERAIVAEPTSELAYRLLARAFRAVGDLAGARRAEDACRTALAELGLEPEGTVPA